MPEQLVHRGAQRRDGPPGGVLALTPIFEFVPAEVYWSPLRRAIRDVALPVVDGAIALPAAPGIGVELPDDLIAHFRIG